MTAPSQRHSQDHGACDESCRTGPADTAGQPLPLGHVLFISRQRLAGRTNGSSAYLLDLAGAVRTAGLIPHLLQPSPDLLGRWPIMRLRPEMAVFASHTIRGVLRIGPWVIARDPRVALSALRACVSRLARRVGIRAGWTKDRPRPYAIAARWTDADRAFVRRADATGADIVIADYAFQAEALPLLPDRPNAIVMHDLFHARADDRDSVVHIDCLTEIGLLSRAGAVIAIQGKEADFVARNVPNTQAILAPMGVCPVGKADPADGRQLLFVGSNTAPNVVGLEWFFAEVWPELRERVPDMRLDVAGAVAAGFAHAPPGVTFHGQVGALDPFYARAGIVISPLTFGSGLKIKLVEALARGKAMVATGVTLQGVEAECAEAVMLADSADAFVEAILVLADDDRRTALANAALAAATRHFSPDVCHGAFREWLQANAPASSRAEGAGKAP